MAMCILARLEINQLLYANIEYGGTILYGQDTTEKSLAKLFALRWIFPRSL